MGEVPPPDESKVTKKQIIRWKVPNTSMVQRHLRNFSPVHKNIYASVVKTDEYRQKYPHYFVSGENFSPEAPV